MLVMDVPSRHGRPHPAPKPHPYPPPLIEEGRHLYLLSDVGVLLVIADYLAVNIVFIDLFFLITWSEQSGRFFWTSQII